MRPDHTRHQSPHGCAVGVSVRAVVGARGFEPPASWTVDAVQDQVLEPAMGGMDLIDLVMGPLDELLVSVMITRWRDAVWRSAVRPLEAASQEERTSVVAQVEQDALKLGRLICLR